MLLTVNQEQFNTLNDKLDAVLELLATLTLQGEELMSDFTALTAQVASETSVEQSVLTLLKGLQAQVAALQPTQAAIDALAAQIGSNITAMTAAVPANTPVTPAAAKANK